MVLKNMLTMQMVMFSLVVIGFIVRKKGIIGNEARKDMIDFCLFVTLPFNILHSFLGEWDFFDACILRNYPSAFHGI